MKLCGMCGESKPLCDFSIRRAAKDGRQSRCKRCVGIAYRTNRPAHLARIKANRDRYKEDCRRYVLAYLYDNPCVDCGEDDPVVLDFDHRSGKRDSVSGLMGQGYTLATIKAEVAKCDVRCANCHRRKTAFDQRWWKIAQNAQDDPKPSDPA